MTVEPDETRRRAAGPPPVAVDAALAGGRRRIAAFALAVLGLASIGDIAVMWRPGADIAAGALVVFVAAALPDVGVRERGLAAVGMVLVGLAAVIVPVPGQAIADALRFAAHLAAFLLLIGTLRDAAVQSASLKKIGAWLTGHPPGRRYVALHVGSHLLALMLSFGVLTLLGPMVRRGVAAIEEREGRPDLSEVRLRRQIVAVMRGFSWIIVWSPTTITQAMLLAMVAGVDGARLAWWGLAIALAMLALGWLEDRLRWRRLRARERSSPDWRPPVATPLPRAAALRLAAIVAALIGAVIAVRAALGIGTVHALMTVVPCLSLAWMALQGRHAGKVRPLNAAFAAVGRLYRGLPDSAREVVTFAAGGFIGKLVAAMVPPELVAEPLAATGAPATLVLVLTPLVVVLAGQMALSPVMSVAFLGSVLVQVPGMDIDPTMLALALAVGWAITLAVSPFTASVLSMARVAAVPATALSWRWNGVYSLAAYGAAAAILVALAV